MPNTTLYDLAILDRADAFTGLIEDVTTLAPEFYTFGAIKRSGTYYEPVKRVQLPTAQFRSVNAGVATSKSSYKKEVKEMFLVDVQLQMDEAIVKADQANVGSLWQLEASGAMRSAAILIGAQTWYGTSADASGFTGARSQLAFVVKAGGTTNSTSAYLCWMDDKEGCRYDVGNDGQFAITAPRLQTVVDPNNSGKVFTAWLGNLNAWVGYNQLSNLSSYGVTGVTASTQSQWLTDDKADQLLAQIPMARRNNLRWFMNRTAISTLRRSRSTVNLGVNPSGTTSGALASYQAAGAAGTPAFSPMPTELVGYPITVTDSIVNTETNS
jgi:hypothetical protein